MTTKGAINYTLDIIGDMVFNPITMTIILNVGVAYIIHEYVMIWDTIGDLTNVFSWHR